jgi:glycosyltransferase involved in cell wall biosynthesis
MTSQKIEHRPAPARVTGVAAAPPSSDPTASMRSAPAGSGDGGPSMAGSAGAPGRPERPWPAPSPATTAPGEGAAASAKVVLCICTCKRPVGLERLLAAVAELDFDGRLSVVVVDNDAAGAAEGVAVCRRAAAAGYCWPLVWAPEERRGIPFARNRAVALALEQNPDFIAALDDDERPSRGWLREMLRVQADTDADAVGGPVLPEFAPDAPAWLVEGGFFGRGGSRPDKAEVRLNACGNFMARASCYRALMPEPFDTRFALTGGEGGIFFRRLAAQSCAMRWAAHAVIHETVPPSRATLRWLMQRRFRLGVNLVRRQRVLQPGLGRELYSLMLAMGQFGTGVIFLVINARQRIRRTRAMLTICKALGRASGHLGASYSEYRRIHGT